VKTGGLRFTFFFFTTGFFFTTAFFTGAFFTVVACFVTVGFGAPVFSFAKTTEAGRACSPFSSSSSPFRPRLLLLCSFLGIF